MASFNYYPQIKKWGSYFFVYVIFFLITIYYIYYSIDGNFNSVYLVSYSLFAILPTAIVFMVINSANVWINRISIYSIIMIFSFILLSIISSYFEYFTYTDANNARYTLSTLIQSEAAIVAIVITLTLVAVQQTSSSYSTRLIDIFKFKNPDFWILLVIYIGSMIYELGILINLNEKFISKDNIFWAYFLGSFSLIALIPYTLNTIDLLKPSNIMAHLSEKITEDSVLFYISSWSGTNNHFVNDNIQNNAPDPLLPIVDMITSSLMKYDYAVSREGLLYIKKSSISILKNYGIEDENYKQVLELFINHFENIGKLAIYKDDKTSVNLVLNWL